MAVSVEDLLAEQLADPETAWSVGAFGAIAEFMRDAGEPAKIGRGDYVVSAITGKGAIRIKAHPKLRPFASESVTRQGWSQRVSLCLPQQIAPMSGHTVLTELGPDREALRDEDRSGIVFDLGLGTVQVDACVRFSDPEVVAALRQHVGKSVFAADSGVMAVILKANPHRVFISRVGRVEVFQPIPPPNGKSPEGPHTHVLPKLLAHRRTHAATEPVPPSWIPCAHFYPPNPMRDGMGRERPFRADHHIRFQNLLLQYGDPDRVALKRRIIYSVAAGHGPEGLTIPEDRFTRASVRVVLRQLRVSDTSSAALTPWLAAYDRAAADEAEETGEPHH